MMTMKEKSNIEQHERKKNEEKEESITYIYMTEKEKSLADD